MGAGVVCLRLWGGASRGGAGRRTAAALALAVGVAELLRRGVATGVDGTWWFWLSSDLLHLVPGIVAWLGALLYFADRRELGEGIDPRRRRATLLFACFATTALFLLYPNADLLHAGMALPAFLPLLAALAARLQQDLEATWRRAGLAFALVFAAVFSAPFALDLARESERQAEERHGFARAAGISGSGPRAREGAALVALLRQPPYAERELFVLSGKQLVYFLAGRASAVEPYEFGIYMASGDLISEEGKAWLIRRGGSRRPTADPPRPRRRRHAQRAGSARPPAPAPTGRVSHAQLRAGGENRSLHAAGPPPPGSLAVAP